MDRVAGDIRPVGRRAGADPLPAVRPAGRREEDARQSRHHARADRLRGGDDGARSPSRTAIRSRPGLRYLPQGDRDRPAAARSFGGGQGDRQAHESRRTGQAGRDRKSTRLNSSHGYISYAVFCLKKKKKKTQKTIKKQTKTKNKR